MTEQPEPTPEVRSKPCTFKGCGKSRISKLHGWKVHGKTKGCGVFLEEHPHLNCHPHQDTDDSSLRSVAVAKEGA